MTAKRTVERSAESVARATGSVWPGRKQRKPLRIPLNL